LVIVTCSGPADPEEIIDILNRLNADPDFSMSYDVLWDARGRTTPFTMDEARRAESHVESYTGNRKPKRAFLVSKDVDFGMARVHESHRYSRSDVAIEIFKVRSDALKWLGLHDHPLFCTGKYSG